MPICERQGRRCDSVLLTIPDMIEQTSILVPKREAGKTFKVLRFFNTVWLVALISHGRCIYKEPAVTQVTDDVTNVNKRG